MSNIEHDRLTSASPREEDRAFDRAIRPKRLEDYVGQYQLSPEFTITVTLESGRLFIQPTGQWKRGVYAESETEFFVQGRQGAAARLTFLRDATGTVTGLTLHQGGKDTPGRKVR